MPAVATPTFPPLSTRPLGLSLWLPQIQRVFYLNQAASSFHPASRSASPCSQSLPSKVVYAFYSWSLLTERGVPLVQKAHITELQMFQLPGGNPEVFACCLDVFVFERSQEDTRSLVGITWYI